MESGYGTLEQKGREEGGDLIPREHSTWSVRRIQKLEQTATASLRPRSPERPPRFAPETPDPEPPGDFMKSPVTPPEAFGPPKDVADVTPPEALVLLRMLQKSPKKKLLKNQLALQCLQCFHCKNEAVSPKGMFIFCWEDKTIFKKSKAFS